MNPLRQKLDFVLCNKILLLFMNGEKILPSVSFSRAMYKNCSKGTHPDEEMQNSEEVNPATLATTIK